MPVAPIAMPTDGQTAPHPSRDSVIPKVSAQLRRVSGDLFMPYTVSIGPYYHRDDDSCVWTQVKESAVVYLEREGKFDLKQVVDGVQSSARGWYTHLADNAMETENFSRMLLRDACYLLSRYVRYERSGSPSRDGRSLESNDNTVERDILFLLENQIPLFVIEKIHGCLKKQGVPKTALMCIAGGVVGLLQEQLYISKTTRDAPSTSSHLLDLVHSYFAAPAPAPAPAPAVASCNIEMSGEASTQPREQWWQWRWRWRWPTQYCCLPSQEMTRMGRWRRATEYRRYANLTFKPRAFDANMAWTILDVHHDDGTLWMPLLRVESNTWTLLRNLMALEERKETSRVTAYCMFMSQLACTAEDVEFLRSAKVIDSFQSSDEAAALGFASLCDGVALDIDKPARNYLKPIWHDMEKRCNSRWKNFKGFFGEKYRSNVFYRSVFAVAFLLFISQMVQTVYTVKGYYQSK